MRQVYEFRVSERHAAAFFGPGEGKKLSSGLVRKVLLPEDDERLPRVFELQRRLSKEHQESFFFGWDIHRYYTPAELLAAELLHVEIGKTFEPAGEECGTRYDETTACAQCGSGATQVGPLTLRVRKPLNADVAQTIASEIIVSPRFMQMARDAGAQNVMFRPVDWVGRSALLDWQQLVIPSAAAEICEPTRIGADPSGREPTDTAPCPRGDYVGLALLSELFVRIVRNGVAGAGFALTRQYVGLRSGLLRPRRLLLVTQPLWRLLEIHEIRGFKVDVAHRC